MLKQTQICVHAVVQRFLRDEIKTSTIIAMLINNSFSEILTTFHYLTAGLHFSIKINRL